MFQRGFLRVVMVVGERVVGWWALAVLRKRNLKIGENSYVASRAGGRPTPIFFGFSIDFQSVR